MKKLGPRFSILVTLLVMLAALALACTPTSTGTKEATQTPPASTPTAAPAASGQQDLMLQVLAPANETIVSTSTVQVKGVASPDAVISVNDAMVEVAADGSFSATVTLEEGPNSIDVVASDFRGNQRSQIITVIYVK